MLTIFRRHEKGCEHGSEGRRYRRCRCPIHVEGLLGGRHVRQSLGTRDWERAQGVICKWEAEGRIERAGPVRFEEAAERFLADARARNLVEETVKKYKRLLRHLKDFAVRSGYQLVRELDVDALSSFRVEWKDGPRASQKKLERLRSFFGFCQKRRWIEENPASELKAPKVSERPTMPFTHIEMMKILGAVEGYREHAAPNARLNAVRIHSLILFLRYSGMRIGDAVSLSIDRLDGNSLFLYTAKTGVPVRVKLPAFVVETLRATPPMVTDRYWFWSGIGKLHTTVGVWGKRLRRIFRLAEIPDGHAHRFRDTFAVEFLNAGGTLEQLSVLLGHRSIRVTERHYAPWVRSRQEQLDAALDRSLAHDPLVLMETNHTPGTRGETERPN